MIWQRCDAIERKLESGETAEKLLQAWHVHALQRYEPFEFQTYWKAWSKETFVQHALNPKLSFDKDLVYPEALAVLQAISTATISEAEIAYYLDWLEAQFPGASMNDLIYWPEEWFGKASLDRGATGAFEPGSQLCNEQILAYTR